MSLASKTITYEFTPQEIKQLIIDALELNESDTATVNFVIEEIGGDPLDRFPGYNDVTGIQVSVKHGV